MKRPVWVILVKDTEAIEPGGPTIEVSTTDSLCVTVEHSTCSLSQLPPLAACQLGQALQEAAAWCGQERARREARQR